MLARYHFSSYDTLQFCCIFENDSNNTTKRNKLENKSYSSLDYTLSHTIQNHYVFLQP